MLPFRWRVGGKVKRSMARILREEGAIAIAHGMSCECKVCERDKLRLEHKCQCPVCQPEDE